MRILCRNRNFIPYDVVARVGLPINISQQSNLFAKSGNFAAICHMSLFLCLIAGILAFGIPAKADQWLCGPSFGSVNARGSDVRSIPIRLAKPETVDALIATSRPDILWRLADIAFVPEFEDAALSAMQNGASAITDLVAYDQTPDFAGRHLADMRDGFGKLWQEKLLETGLVMLCPNRPSD